MKILLCLLLTLTLNTNAQEVIDITITPESIELDCDTPIEAMDEDMKFFFDAKCPKQYLPSAGKGDDKQKDLNYEEIKK